MPLTSEVLQDRYRIVALLDRGGMGAVYRDWHLGLEMLAAIKKVQRFNQAQAAHQHWPIDIAYITICGTF